MIPVAFPTTSLAALLEQHPPPWRVGRRRNLPISRSEALELYDSNNRLVIECSSSTVGDGLVAAINGAYATSLELAIADITTNDPTPHRGQESEVEPPQPENIES